VLVRSNSDSFPYDFLKSSPGAWRICAPRSAREAAAVASLHQANQYVELAFSSKPKFANLII
jgi:hypothetical protein